MPSRCTLALRQHVALCPWQNLRKLCISFPERVDGVLGLRFTVLLHATNASFHQSYGINVAHLGPRRLGAKRRVASIYFVKTMWIDIS